MTSRAGSTRRRRIPWAKDHLWATRTASATMPLMAFRSSNCNSATRWRAEPSYADRRASIAPTKPATVGKGASGGKSRTSKSSAAEAVLNDAARGARTPTELAPMTAERNSATTMSTNMCISPAPRANNAASSDARTRSIVPILSTTALPGGDTGETRSRNRV